MIKALIFDCFGVLATEGWIQFRDKQFSGDKDGLNQANDLMKAVNLGMISSEELLQQISDLVSMAPADIGNILFRNVPNDELFSFIRALRGQYKMGILSNIQSGRLPKLFSDEQLALFDDLALSFEIGIAKPDPNAYFIAAERLGVMPEECLFVDDQEKNVVVARSLGMEGLVYEEFAKFKADAEKILG